MGHAERDFGLARMVAIVSPGNRRPAGCSSGSGSASSGSIRLGEETAEVELFGSRRPDGPAVAV